MSKIIVMMGAPGAGKGTQARLLSEKYGYPQISTGDLLREMSQAETPLAGQLKETISSGALVSDEVLADLIISRTSAEDCKNGYLLDGFPRTLVQANLLDDLARRQGNEIRVFSVTLTMDCLLKRLSGRRTCTLCGEIYNIFFRPPKREGFCDLDQAPLQQRSDDFEESVNRRLAAYLESTLPLIDYYRKGGRLKEIDGQRSVAEVFAKLSESIDDI
ncbi:MAG: nucleoside monophosphate kinase [Acidobacteria bacterium]|nr:nucleoside monophosphate kinase [Acidobacteriota bacterium]